MTTSNQPEVRRYPNCWGCGPSNGAGLNLAHRLEGDVLVMEFTPQAQHEGWPGITHGGIILSLLYEVAENQQYLSGQTVMMKSIDTRFRQPLPTGDIVTGKAWRTGESGREIRVSAALYGESGSVVAEASAVLVNLTDRQKERLGIN